MFAAVAVAQNSTDTETLPELVEQLPQCAMSCFKQGASAVNCALTDFACLCGDKKQQFINDITPCVAFGAGCNSEDLNSMCPASLPFTNTHTYIYVCVRNLPLLTLLTRQPPPPWHPKSAPRSATTRRPPPSRRLRPSSKTPPRRRGRVTPPVVPRSALASSAWRLWLLLPCSGKKPLRFDFLSFILHYSGMEEGKASVRYQA